MKMKNSSFQNNFLIRDRGMHVPGFRNQLAAHAERALFILLKERLTRCFTALPFFSLLFPITSHKLRSA